MNENQNVKHYFLYLFSLMFWGIGSVFMYLFMGIGFILNKLYSIILYILDFVLISYSEDDLVNLPLNTFRTRIWIIQSVKWALFKINAPFIIPAYEVPDSGQLYYIPAFFCSIGESFDIESRESSGCFYNIYAEFMRWWDAPSNNSKSEYDSWQSIRESDNIYCQAVEEILLKRVPVQKKYLETLDSWLFVRIIGIMECLILCRKGVLEFDNLGFYHDGELIIDREMLKQYVLSYLGEYHFISLLGLEVSLNTLAEDLVEWFAKAMFEIPGLMYRFRATFKNGKLLLTKIKTSLDYISIEQERELLNQRWSSKYSSSENNKGGN